MKKNTLFTICITFILMFSFVIDASAFWVWTPKSKFPVNPKYAVKDTPREQYSWAMYFFGQNDFDRAAEEFVRLVEFYPDSELAPESQYYAGRSYEEQGKYLFAFQSYQKTVEKYPYTKRMEEIIEREFNIANTFRDKETPKLMDLELSVSLERAIEVYNDIVENNPFGKYSDKALLNAAGCYRRIGKYPQAIESYEKIINDYPESEIVPEAKYQMAYAKYEASLEPEYDQESTEQALRDFQEISETTAVPALAEEANKVLSELKIRKAESEMKVAEFYEKRKKYQSAIFYYGKIIAKYRGTASAEKAKERITILEGKIKK